MTPDASWRPPLGFGELHGVLPDRTLRPVAGEVASIARDGGKVTLRFKEEALVSQEERCWPTQRIASLEYEHREAGAGRATTTGRVTYEQQCELTGEQKVVGRTAAPPLTVDAAELGVIAPGDLVYGLAGESGHGGVVAVTRADEVIQLRSHPLGR